MKMTKIEFLNGRKGNFMKDLSVDLARKYCSYLTLIGKSWKTHPKFFSKFRFPWHDIDQFLENSSIIFSKFRFPGFGKSWKTHPYFSNTSVFRGMTKTNFWKMHSLFRNFDFRSVKQTAFWKIHPIADFRTLTETNYWKTHPKRGFMKKNMKFPFNFMGFLYGFLWCFEIEIESVYLFILPG